MRTSRTLCIVCTPDPIACPAYALHGLVGLEFVEDHERVARIIAQCSYMRLAPTFLVCVDIQVILEQLRLLRRHAALAYWTEFSCCCPLLYIPRDCCETVIDYV